MYEIYGRTEKILFLFLGMLIVSAVVYTTHLYLEYRVVNNMWTQTFNSPKEFWAVVPKWEWTPVIEQHIILRD